MCSVGLFLLSRNWGCREYSMTPKTAIGRVLKYAPVCFEVLLCRSFMIERTAQ